MVTGRRLASAISVLHAMTVFSEVAIQCIGRDLCEQGLDAGSVGFPEVTAEVVDVGEGG